MIVAYLDARDAIQSLWKTDSGQTWFVTMEDEGDTDILLRKGNLEDNETSIMFRPVNRKTIFIRVHWLPLWVENESVFSVNTAG